MDSDDALNLYHLAFRAANDPKALPGDLRELALSEDELVRGAVAMNLLTPQDVLQELLNDSSAHVKECLSKRVEV
ncbi:hypothetical protein [Pseudomonas lurida]|uniref:Uncharacterized protein n=1 Tax=Pseudomonas lurida TaxID=244566 RepID=A0ABY9FQ03_9PSED|nr:hypothetical protein [Pseudomonas lurida]WLH05378.1 hypothetical protein PSH67_21425 [Pseudomonas lurida]